MKFGMLMVMLGVLVAFVTGCATSYSSHRDLTYAPGPDGVPVIVGDVTHTGVHMKPLFTDSESDVIDYRVTIDADGASSVETGSAVMGMNAAGQTDALSLLMPVIAEALRLMLIQGQESDPSVVVPITSRPIGSVVIDDKDYLRYAPIE